MFILFILTNILQICLYFDYTTTTIQQILVLSLKYNVLILTNIIHYRIRFVTIIFVLSYIKKSLLFNR